MKVSFRSRTRRTDRIARWLITLGGMAIIFSVIFILLLIVNVTLPLFSSSTVAPTASIRLPHDISADQSLAIGLDDYLENTFLIDRNGVFRFFSLVEAGANEERSITPPTGEQLSDVEPMGRMQYALRWSDGSLTLAELAFNTFFDESEGNRRTIRYEVKPLASFSPVETEGLQRSLARRSDDGSTTRIDLLAGNRLRITQSVLTENFLGETEEERFEELLGSPLPGRITVLTLDRSATHLYAGTTDGFLLKWSLEEPGEARLQDKVRANGDGSAITALALVFGDVSLAVGDAKGRLSTWSPVREATDSTRWTLTQLHALTPHPSAVIDIIPSLRDKSILSFSKEGGLHLDHMTSERHLLELPSSQPLSAFALTNRSDALVTLTDDGELTAWRIDNPHPEVSLKTLFGKVWYEGYDKPVWAWQSSSASDDFEPKLSLTPLIFGTLKGTFYAMLFALPLALFGAIYTSQFCRPKVRAMIKPTVEIMAAIPTVIIGFMAALWLAPMIEKSLGAVFLGVIFVPTSLMIAIILWQGIREIEPLKHVERGYEFLAAIPIVVIAVALSFTLGPWFENLFFGGDLKQWLFTELGTRYDPRNCIIIAFAMGFAVIPIIFTIAEDSLSNVPPSLKAASLACGASRWQTVWRVILPSASPGIFAGVMIGFGRAVGETMIVLMATGNTAIMDLSIFNGMRPLSANIAVEIPEAPYGATLYRVLFLSAVILFVMTFIVNTVAEVIRQRLRAKYGRF